MKFLVVNEKKVNDEVLVTGYLEPENAKEQEGLLYCIVCLKKENVSNKHMIVSGNKLFLMNLQMELVKMNLKAIAETYGCKMRIAPAQGFEGNLEELKEAVQAKE